MGRQFASTSGAGRRRPRLRGHSRIARAGIGKFGLGLLWGAGMWVGRRLGGLMDQWWN
ncbi:hypothetical protein [Streptomyces rimosus]|uniref:hypothetical protein n=1 Tax=Streptomyces rimosus TaxID=1927 RepID=UPI000AA49FDD|nr:hypothetical protein [Streptomyces rimosus]